MPSCARRSATTACERFVATRLVPRVASASADAIALSASASLPATEVTADGA